MSQLKYLCGNQLAYLATTAAVALSKDFDTDDLVILSSFFNAIGDSLGIISAQQAAIDAQNNISCS